jgi:hypothetical protein
MLAVETVTNLWTNLAKTGIIYSNNNKENNNNNYFLTIEEILCTALHKEGFATEDSKLDYTAQGVDDVAIEETSSSVDYSRLTLNNGLGTSKSEYALSSSIIEQKLPFLLFLPLILCR